MPDGCLAVASINTEADALIKEISCLQSWKPIETDFSQIRAFSTDFGNWDNSPFINYFYFLINKFDFFDIFDLSDKFIT